jgi:hypothetical protein
MEASYRFSTRGVRTIEATASIQSPITATVITLKSGVTKEWFNVRMSHAEAQRLVFDMAEHLLSYYGACSPEIEALAESQRHHAKPMKQLGGVTRGEDSQQ